MGFGSGGKESSVYPNRGSAEENGTGEVEARQIGDSRCHLEARESWGARKWGMEYV